MTTITDLPVIPNIQSDDEMIIRDTSTGKDTRGSLQDVIDSLVTPDAVTSVNTKTGTVVIDPDDLVDTTTTNKFTTAGNISKLAGIETNATQDQTGSEIKVLYEGEADTNAFTDAEQTKLAGLATDSENNTASNLGTGEGVFGVKTGVDLQFKSLVTSGQITTSSSASLSAFAAASSRAL